MLDVVLVDGDLSRGLEKFRKYVGNLSENAAVPRLHQAIGEGTRYRSLVLEGLASIASPLSFEVVRPFIDSSDAADRRQAARYLARVGSDEARQLLEEKYIETDQLEFLAALAAYGAPGTDQLILARYDGLDPLRVSSTYQSNSPWTLWAAARSHGGQLLSDGLGERLRRHLETEERLAESANTSIQSWVESQMKSIDERLAALDNPPPLDADFVEVAERLRGKFGAKPGEGLAGIEFERQRFRDHERKSLVAARDGLDSQPTEQFRKSVESALWYRVREVASVLVEIASGADRDLAMRTLYPWSFSAGGHSMRSADRSDEYCTVFELVEEDSTQPVTRFGGLPTFHGPPTWPIDPSGEQMAFWGQFEIPWKPGSLAYLFIARASDNMEEHGTAALFVQPGPTPSVPWEPRAEGPSVLVDNFPADDRFGPPRYSRFATCVAKVATTPTGQVPEVDRVFEQIGGAPRWNQGDAHPGDGWRFLFQFRASTVGHEIADGADCYGFVHEDNRARFIWQCS